MEDDRIEDNGIVDDDVLSSERGFKRYSWIWYMGVWSGKVTAQTQKEEKSKQYQTKEKKSVERWDEKTKNTDRQQHKETDEFNDSAHKESSCKGGG